ncbi:hypothetical protein WJX82_010972 [Trebouxia sp. C0006]
MSTLPYPTTYLGSSARLTPFRNAQTSLVNPRQQPQRCQRVRRRAQVTRADGFQNLINQISEVVTNSPVNNLKKGIAKVQAGDYDEAAIRAKVDNYLNDNPVVVFSWTGCPFCKNAKALLDSKGANYTAVELNTMDDGNAIRAQLAQMTNRTSMPNIFIKGKSFGGCNDGPGVATLDKQGKLIPLLKQAGAL